jgi:hypothetical protein
LLNHLIISAMQCSNVAISFRLFNKKLTIGEQNSSDEDVAFTGNAVLQMYPGSGSVRVDRTSISQPNLIFSTSDALATWPILICGRGGSDYVDKDDRLWAH